jgi:hypothetical protein
VDSGQSAAVWAELLVLVASLGLLADDAARCENDDVLAAELLLELLNQTLLLDQLLVMAVLWVWDEDSDG